MSKQIKMQARPKTKPTVDQWIGHHDRDIETPTRTKPKRLTIDLDPELHRRLKLHCVESDTEISALLRLLIIKELG